MSSLSFHDKQHVLRLLQQQGQVKRIFDDFTRRSGLLLTKWTEKNADNVWVRNATLEKQIDKLLTELHDDLLSNIQNNTTGAWEASNLKNDELLTAFIKDMALPELIGKSKFEELEKGMFAHNMEALKAFQQRKIEGLTLSDTVWKSVDGAKQNLEYYLSSGISTGRPAASIASDIRQLLQDPDKRFRRVKNKEGKLILSKPMENYNPGQGRYRSSYKNALRIAATETNQAYHTADYERWQKQDFVIGIEVFRSKSNKGPCKICDPMVGRYPKGYKFKGQHPWCICQAVPIMLEGEDFIDFLMTGEVPEEMMIKDVPQSAIDFVNAQKENQEQWFVKENKQYFIHADKDIIGTARANASMFDTQSKEIAANIGVTVTNVNIKSDKRIYEKARLDYNGDVSKVKDIIRNTFITDSNSEDLLKEIAKTFNIDRIKHQSADTDPLGYSGTLLNVRLKNDTFAEIQINSAQMIYGKDVSPRTIIGDRLYRKIQKETGLSAGWGHIYYEEWRSLDRLNPNDQKRIKELEKLSRDYYNKLRAVKL